MIKYITPEDNDNVGIHYFKVFLAGTIDNGDSKDWQKEVFTKLIIRDINVSSEVFGNEYNHDEKYIKLFSPRRSNWNKNASSEEHIKQIKWEQEKLDEADLIIMCLQDNSKSPISLLELGLYGPSGKLICFCTPNFYRYNNVKLTCDKYLIPLIEDISEEKIADEIERIYKEILY